MKTMIRSILTAAAAVSLMGATNGSTGSPTNATNDGFFTMNVAGSLAENAMLLNRASFISANSITLDVSGLFTISERSALMGLYEFIYDGPGISPQDAERMSERVQDHNVVVKYMHDILPNLTLSGRIDGTAEFYKLSQSEAWGSGIFDYLRGGGEVEAQWNYLGSHSAALAYSIGYLYFPRFTDLYTEYLTGSSLNQEVSRESHVLQVASIVAENDSHEPFTYRVSYRFTARNFVNPGVIGADALYYPNVYQFGLAHTATADIAWEMMFMIPGIGLDYENSASTGYHPKPLGTNNQTIGINYDFNDIRARLTLTFVLSKEIQATVFGTMSYKYYPHFPIQDASGVYQAEKMYTRTVLAGLAWNFKLGEYYRLIPSYTFKWVDANNKYGDGTAFNYDVHGLGLLLSFDF
ncbi:MAG: hypothetical protein AABZ39_00075 [Spirochaetota bacterium]